MGRRGMKDIGRLKRSSDRGRPRPEASGLSVLWVDPVERYPERSSSEDAPGWPGDPALYGLRPQCSLYPSHLEPFFPARSSSAMTFIFLRQSPYIIPAS